MVSNYDQVNKNIKLLTDGPFEEERVAFGLVFMLMRKNNPSTPPRPHAGGGIKKKGRKTIVLTQRRSDPHGLAPPV